MRRRTLRLSILPVITLLIASSAVVHARDQQRVLSFTSVALAPKERIVAIEISLTSARFLTVRIPNDWGLHVEGPLGDCRLSAQCGHGASALSSIHELDRFVTLAIREPSSFRISASIHVTTDFEHSAKRLLSRSQLLLRNI
jgi:hypothetical protein